ncbi:hypothetical protein [Nocardioides bigeumensis]|uniref:Uncharacterized protein n=1 Tax=Nocardioides bigeumensis TaxID=433657 RepID=A0ABN2YFH8_9ACTN
MLLDYTLAVHQARQRNDELARRAEARSRFEETGRRRRRKRRG